jgi:thymidine phosphorylase
VGDRVEKGQPLATIFATAPERIAEPVALLREAIQISDDQPAVKGAPLIQHVFTHENAEAYLADADKVKKTALSP